MFAVVVLCAPDQFIHTFMKNASQRDMIDGSTGKYMYLSVQNAHHDVSHPWSNIESDPSADTLAAYRHLMQVS